MANKDGALTPMMKQYFDLKAKHPDALLLFRCGDFYEAYHGDAEEAARVLGITLTHRSSVGSQQGTAMAGFPFHALDNYLPKLIRAGKRVAICDQLEDPKTTNKLVKRGITELVTPGVTTNDNVLSFKENNFVCSVVMPAVGTQGIAFLDLSTGEFFCGEGDRDYIDKLIVKFQPKEIIFEQGQRHIFEEMYGTKYYTYETADWYFTYQTCREKLLRHFNVSSLKGFGIDRLEKAVSAAGSILQYLEQTQHINNQHITSISRIDESKYVRLDKFTIRSLELLGSMQDDGKSLLDVIDRTISPMGARLLRRWIVFPLMEKDRIDERLDIVEYFFRQPDYRQLLSEQLHRVGDMERIVSKVATQRIGPRDMVQLKISLQAVKIIRNACLYADNDMLKKVGESLDDCEQLADSIAQKITDTPPLLTSKGDFIRDGVDAELDELRRIAFSGKDYLLELQQREIEATGISSLKIGFNNVFGYYLEVRNTFKDQVPETWIRKQTLVQAERYITQELKEYEEKIMGAEDRIAIIENRIFAELVEEAFKYISKVQTNAALLAQLDCLHSFAEASEENRYVRPVITDTDVLDIKNGRHPVIEKELPVGEAYIPNNVYLDTEKQQIIIITGPNMAGKSALLRQTALITLMAQIGCFVPCDAASIGIVDKIFTRVGASDNISVGESTFMVEMTEAANILNSTTNRSLVLFDELGRGTSTYDGISIAWSIVEYLHEQKNRNARTLFATHYHELNEMEKHFKRIKNYNVSVKEVDNKVIFLRRLERGGSEHSFGIHVAQMAGMPKTVVKRAENVLKQLESDKKAVSPDTRNLQSQGNMQLSFFQLDDPVLSQVRDEILNLDINNLSPLEALNKLNDIKKIVRGK
ncbi:MAG: DNA mismatch repair protein MutS [Bacteroidaceae bacterium]|nr:DNA mismatch repair protein MutS [Bacteroidaceae bacterium]